MHQVPQPAQPALQISACTPYEMRGCPQALALPTACKLLGTHTLLGSMGGVGESRIGMGGHRRLPM